MQNYKRLTKRDKEFGIIAMCPACSRNATCKEQGECVACVDEVYNRLAELEDKIENGTLVFREKTKKKYYAIVGYCNCYGKFDWHIHYVPIEYEKEYNQVALNIDGRLFVTKRDLLFNTTAEAEKQLKLLKEKQNG